MFSSNQLLAVSGDLSHSGDLRNALEFALKKDGAYESFTRSDRPSKCVFQITENGDYCIGWGCHDEKPSEGWTEFQFDFDIDIIAAIIEKHLQKQKVREYGGDGSSSLGFLMENIDYKKESVKKRFYGIVVFSPYTCYYAK